MFCLSIITLLISFTTVINGEFTQVGCFDRSSVKGLTSKGSYIYQSTSYCQEQCSGHKYAALISGSTCYCGDTSIDESNSVDISNCDTPCQGYDSTDCGGNGYYLIFEDSSVEVSEAASSSTTSSSSSSSTSTSTSTSSSSRSTSSTASSTSTSSSSSSSVSSSPSLTSSDSPSSSSETSPTSSASSVVSTVTNSGTVTTITTTSQPSATSSESSSNDDNDDNNDKKQKKSGLSGGAIAGIVVGSVAGIGIIGLLAFLFLIKRRNADDEEDDDFNEKDINGFTLAGPSKNYGNDITPNPFVTKNSTIKSKHTKNQSFNSHSFNSNNEDFMFSNPNNEGLPYPMEDYGRRRLSDGSLPDMVTKGSLKVVNN
ncbi:protein Slg1p [[Candida] jaroonii]|uniref:Protein Slg1p n=1 Tax=[Candida] jaroonii TaxID=467808 RepID=A0ACA9YDS8_9ASCO|nr:protein Slg1p [[Candida] jaroonii]